MEYSTLGAATQAPLRVSRICLGTMTWGEQNSEADAHSQLDFALERGVNFIDAAEMYPVPPRKETSGKTEAYIGSWLKKRGKRDDVILASKVAGPTEVMAYLRQNPDLDARGIAAAIEGSLKRLNTDYIDLYQLHWPSRSTNCFGRLNYTHSEKDGVPLEESLEAVERLVQSGKVRQVGLSNETPWGVMQAKRQAEKLGWRPVVSVQNPYNLLNRSFEVGLAEVAHREDTPLLAYSPMAFGSLSGKYILGMDKPENRLNQFTQFPRYTSETGVAATRDHIKLAQEFGLSPAALALAFVNTRSFVGASIIGATNLEQLEENIASINVRLSDEQQAAIEAFSVRHSNPCP